jgi:tellurium resistance protein TerD
MSITLEKKQKLQLKKSVTKYKVALGWKANDRSGKEFDVDASIFVLYQDGQVKNDSVVFYNQKSLFDGKIKHLGDNKTGYKENSSNKICETILVDLDGIDDQITTLAITVTIHDFETRKLNFGMIKDCFVILYDANTDEQVLKYSLSDEVPTATGLHFANIQKNGNIWEFAAIGEPINNGLGGACDKFGLAYN